MTTAAILAAGSSSRLGQPKQLVVFQGQTLIERAARAALDAGAARVIVIVGSQSETVRGALADLPLEICFNPDWATGMASSARVAVENAGESAALLLSPCDLPLISSVHLRALMENWDEKSAPIVASRYAQIVGAPLVIGREFWPELRQLRGDKGARAIVERHAEKVVAIDWPQGEFDLDTPAQLSALTRIGHKPSAL